MLMTNAEFNPVSTVFKNRTLPSVYNALSRVFITFNWEQILMLVENYHHLQTFSVIYL